jgi:hypothetical protein
VQLSNLVCGREERRLGGNFSFGSDHPAVESEHCTTESEYRFYVFASIVVALSMLGLIAAFGHRTNPLLMNSDPQVTPLPR